MKITHIFLFALCNIWMPNVVAATTSVANQPTKILVLGDSLSAAYGIDQANGWVTYIKTNYLPTNSEIINAGISGDTTFGGLNRLPALLKQHQPDIVILELGANDALQGMPLANSKNNLLEMIKLSKKAHAQVLMIGMQIPPNFGPQYSEQFKSMYTDLAKNTDSALVPFLFDGFALNQEWFQSDGLHPNEKAQPTMAKNVWSVLKGLIKSPL